MAETGPRQTPMGEAAGSPVGGVTVTAATKIRDIIISVIAPFTVPGLIFAIVRSSSAHPLGVYVLGDIAFGFVAIAIAGTARAAASKSDVWQAFGLGAVIVISLQTALAVTADNLNLSDELQESVNGAQAADIGPRLPRIQELIHEIADKQATPMQWTLSLTTGLMLAFISVELIRRGN